MKLNNIKNIVGGNNRNSPIGRFAKLPGGCAGISIVCKMIQYLNTRDILNLVESSFVKQLNKIYYAADSKMLNGLSPCYFYNAISIY